MTHFFGGHVRLDNDVFKCLICNESFLTHQAVCHHAASTSRHLWCNRCEYIFQTPQELESHLDMSKAHNICYFCPGHPDFNTQGLYQNHVDSKHPICEICVQPFANGDALDAHMREYHAKGDRSQQIGPPPPSELVPIQRRTAPVSDAQPGPSNALVLHRSSQRHDVSGSDVQPGPSNALVLHKSSQRHVASGHSPQGLHTPTGPRRGHHTPTAPRQGPGRSRRGSRDSRGSGRSRRPGQGDETPIRPRVQDGSLYGVPWAHPAQGHETPIRPRVQDGSLYGVPWAHPAQGHETPTRPQGQVGSLSGVPLVHHSWDSFAQGGETPNRPAQGYETPIRARGQDGSFHGVPLEYQSWDSFTQGGETPIHPRGQVGSLSGVPLEYQSWDSFTQGGETPIHPRGQVGSLRGVPWAHPAQADETPTRRPRSDRAQHSSASLLARSPDDNLVRVPQGQGILRGPPTFAMADAVPSSAQEIRDASGSGVQRGHSGALALSRRHSQSQQVVRRPSQGEVRFKCRHCGRPFSRFDHFLCHLECGACGQNNLIRRVIHQEYMPGHNRFCRCNDRNHDRSQPWICHGCHRTFPRLHGLYAHAQDSLDDPCTRSLRRGATLHSLQNYLVAHT